jgi:predicted RNA binding protein YcfA (HicA-like mRNA interferase family)
MMSKFEKALQRLRQNPKHVRFQEIEKILVRLGFEKRQEGTSHAVFSKPGCEPITVPKRKPFVKPHYVKELLSRLDEWGILDE